MSDYESYAPNLMKYLPDWYLNSKIMEPIQNAIATQIGMIKFSQRDLLEQFYIDTATWGLESLWERPLGISVDLNKSYKDRRELVKARIRGTGTATEQMIKNTTEAFFGGRCNITQHPENYSFNVQFVDTRGIPNDLDAFKKIIDDIKPAHLNPTYSFRYYLVQEIDNVMTLDDLETQTLDKFAF